MNMSPTLANLAAALSKAQGEIEGARKTSANPYFKSKYADLAEVWDACRAALVNNGLAVAQFPISQEDGVGVETILLHSSGEWLSQSFFLPMTATKGEGLLTAQAGGSCITYARRYALAAAVGVCPEDDDANAAAAAPRSPRPDLRTRALAGLKAAAAKGLESLEASWKALDGEQRRACLEDLPGLKKEAASHATPAV